ncbi:YitT family protein [Radiobacillus kanasensis]|uniref:YitT family protein n=1 Tax=Radiobacillus kanasensis TaxID=2844358 RepID=UPI001E48C0B6|nr:YitT family protein [Radiobacillus kanasensis]UFU01181.1 YitT family protein [Radiobacillus kanasensis]
MSDFAQRYGYVTAGGLLQGLAMAVFLFPHSIPSGGSAGIAVLMNYWFNIPLSFALWIVNFSLLVVAIYWLGNASAIGTMYAITITSISVHICSVIESPFNVWVDLLIGAIILGNGIGMLLKQNVSNGGMGVLALIVTKYREIPPGKPLLLFNGSVFVLTGSIIAWEIVVQALICQWISTKVVDDIHTEKRTFHWLRSFFTKLKT